MNNSPGLCHADTSVLLVIDIQERLAEAMPEEQLARLSTNTAVLLQAAEALAIPTLTTEQYPRGLGQTLQAIKQHYPPNTTPLEKTAFSCCSADGFSQALDTQQRRQLILTGMETHICVLQTALELKHRGFDVYVAADAVCARSTERTENGLERMRAEGIRITHCESVIFEWLKDASHPAFKQLSKLIR